MSLQEKGLLTSRVGDATPERGGRAKRYFTVTKPGARQLREARQAFVGMWTDAEDLIQRAAR